MAERRVVQLEIKKAKNGGATSCDRKPASVGLKSLAVWSANFRALEKQLKAPKTWFTALRLGCRASVFTWTSHTWKLDRNVLESERHDSDRGGSCKGLSKSCETLDCTFFFRVFQRRSSRLRKQLWSALWTRSKSNGWENPSSCRVTRRWSFSHSAVSLMNAMEKLHFA